MDWEAVAVGVVAGLVGLALAVSLGGVFVVVGVVMAVVGVVIVWSARV